MARVERCDVTAMSIEVVRAWAFSRAHSLAGAALFSETVDLALSTFPRWSAAIASDGALEILMHCKCGDRKLSVPEDVDPRGIVALVRKGIEGHVYQHDRDHMRWLASRGVT